MATAIKSIDLKLLTRLSFILYNSLVLYNYSNFSSVYIHKDAYQVSVIKKLSLTLITTIVTVAASTTYAGGSQDSGKTTCYVLKNDKLVKKSSCGYESALSSSTNYHYNSYDFTIPSHKNIETATEISAKTDKNDNAIVDKSGSTVFEPAVITINGKPATPNYRYAKTLKAVPKQQTLKYETTEPKGVLSCMQSKDRSLEICAPYPDVSFGGF